MVYNELWEMKQPMEPTKNDTQTKPEKKRNRFIPTDEIVFVPKPPDFVPVKTWPEGDRRAGKPRCTAWSARNGRQCDAYALKRSGETQKCRAHGGLVPRGLSHPGTKMYKYSKFLPDRLLERFLTSTNDPDILSMQSEIALMDVRIEELLDRSDTGESGETWTKALKEFMELESAIRSGDSVEAAGWLNALRETIDKGLSDYHNWQEIQTVADSRRKMVETERKRLETIQAMIPVSDAMLLMRAVVESVKKHVNDQVTLNLIKNDIFRLTDMTPKTIIDVTGGNNRPPEDDENE